jgi:mitotic spindle assembly checkpoint protein MAD1
MVRNQPTYDFLAGPGSPSKPHQPNLSLRHSTTTRSDASTDELKAEVKALQYELSTLKQERELTELRQEKDVRAALQKGEADFQRAELATSNANIASQKLEALSKELKAAHDAATNVKLDLERKLRTAQTSAQSLEEELTECQSELSTQERGHARKMADLESRFNGLQGTMEDLQHEFDQKASQLQAAQQKLSANEAKEEELEREVSRLKDQSGDAGALQTVRRELSEQVAHIKKLETTNRDQAAELMRFRQRQESIKVIEEEKKTLEAKVKMMDDLRRDLSETQLQKQILEEGRNNWSMYLQSEGHSTEYSTPEELARAFMSIQLENASLTEKLGGIRPELKEKDGIIQSLEDAKAALALELEKLRGGNSNESRVRARIERHRVLAVKEAELLRKQLKMFETEETSIQPGSFDEANTRRITEMESVLDQYRAEIQTLTEELAKSQDGAIGGVKRLHEETTPALLTADDERIGTLLRKNRTLHEDLSKAQKHVSLLSKELEIQVEKNTSLKSTQHRILQLRENPTTKFETTKLSLVKSLREENAALLAKVTSQGSTDRKKSSAGPTVPLVSLENARTEYAELQMTLADRDKRLLRLRQIFGSKSAEFREAVCSILGWKLEFQPNGRVRCTSLYWPRGGAPSAEDADGKKKVGKTSDDAGDEEEENSILFDGEAGTMKILDAVESATGADRGPFKAQVEPLVRYWMEGTGAGAVPCLLAQLTLEFYERGLKS